MEKNSIDPTRMNRAIPFRFIDYILIMVVIAILVIIGTVLIQNLNALNSSYEIVINQALKDAPKSEVEKAGNYSSLLAFSRAKDFSNIKASAMFVGFLLIFTGALYLIKVFNQSYEINVNRADVGSVSFNSSSPGLVMITLGVVVMICVLSIKTDVDYSFETGSSGKEQVTKELDYIIQFYLNQTRLKKELPPEVIRCCPVIVDQSNDSARGIRTFVQKRKSSVKRPSSSRLSSVKPQNGADKKNFISFTNNAELEGKQSNPQIQQLIALMKQNPNLKIKLAGMAEKETVAEQAMMIKAMVNSIKSLLVNNGIQHARIRVVSSGESNPVASDDSIDKIVGNGVAITYETQ